MYVVDFFERLVGRGLIASHSKYAKLLSTSWNDWN